jgi:predicted O-methyltransferase YrrM
MASEQEKVVVDYPEDERDQKIVQKVVGYHCLKDPAVEIPDLFDTFRATPAKRFLEIGTWQGATCSAVALAFPEAEIWTVDLPNPEKTQWNPQKKALTGLAYRRLGLQRRIKQLWMHSRELSRFHGKEKFDLIFVDGDHSQPGCFSDLETVRNLLSDEGLIVVHDYTDEKDTDRPPWTKWVHAAVQGFCDHHGFVTERLGGWLVALHQPGSTRRVFLGDEVGSG